MHAALGTCRLRSTEFTFVKFEMGVINKSLAFIAKG